MCNAREQQKGDRGRRPIDDIPASRSWLPPKKKLPLGDVPISASHVMVDDGDVMRDELRGVGSCRSDESEQDDRGSHHSLVWP
jgi:hypothetical protein